jgi:rod shape-determining protein MreD
MAAANTGRGEAKRPFRLPGVSPVLLVPVLVVFLQATLVARLRLGGVCPDALLAAVVAWGLLRGISSGLTWSFVGGILFDLVAGLPLGTSALALMIVCFLTGISQSNLFQGNMLLPIVVIVFATPLHAAIVLLAEQLRHVSVDWAGVGLHVILPETVLNMVTVALIFPPLRWLADKVGAERLNW